jgi:hypothetical protein
MVQVIVISGKKQAAAAGGGGDSGSSNMLALLHTLETDPTAVFEASMSAQ